MCCLGQLSVAARGMIYKVETSLKCAGVCGREQGGESERRKTQMADDRFVGMGCLGWGRNDPGEWLAGEGRLL